MNTHATVPIGSGSPDAVRGAAFRSRLWVDRGLRVGASLGAAAGSILPFVGTIIGGCVGLVAGAVIGVAVAAFAYASRKWFPASPEVTNFRERLCCIAMIWVLAMLVHVWAGLGLWGVAPAVLGTLHALFAGPPEPDAVYCGRPSALARLFCRGLPISIAVVGATGWTLLILAAGMR